MRDWGQEEKGMTEDEMAGWHHCLDGHEFEWTPGVGDGQGGLACYSSWGCKESDTTERLNWTELNCDSEFFGCELWDSSSLVDIYRPVSEKSAEGGSLWEWMEGGWPGLCIDAGGWSECIDAPDAGAWSESRQFSGLLWRTQFIVPSQILLSLQWSCPMILLILKSNHFSNFLSS